MKINNTAITSFALSNDKEGNIVLRKTGEIPNKQVRGKEKGKLQEIKDIVAQHNDMTECAVELVEKGFVVSGAEGRRLFVQLKGGSK